MNQTTGKTNAFRWLWGVLPWVVVLGVVVFIFSLYQNIQAERSRLEKIKQEAIKKETPPIRVITLKVTPGRLEDKIKLPGYIEPAENLLVKAEVPGQVVRILTKEGAHVKQGQVIA